MSPLELKNFIRATLVARRTINQELAALDAIIDFIAQSITTGIPSWDDELEFNMDGSGAGAFCTYPDVNGALRFWKSKTDDNLNHLPPSNPLITENTFWLEVSPSPGSAIKEWAPGIYGTGLVIVAYDVSESGADLALYQLKEATRPFNSINFATELAANKWKRMSGGAGLGALAATYDDITDLIADQEAQVLNAWYLVIDASTDPSVETGWAIYQYLGTVDEDLGDYMKVQEQESLDVTINDASETVKGIAEFATQGETDAGVDDTKTITPLKLKVFTDGNYVSLTGNQTISGNKVWTGTHSFESGDLSIWNPAGTFKGTFIVPALAADRQWTLPTVAGTLLTGPTTAGRILFGIGSALDNSGGFLWNNTTNTQTINSSNAAGGLLIQNSTAATLGVQTNSALLRIQGQGFANTPATTMPAEVTHQVKPVQGAPYPSLTYDIGYSINAGAGGAPVGTMMTIAPGAVTLPGQLFIGQTTPYGWTGRATMYANGVGIIMLSNNAGTDFTRLQLGGTGNTRPSIKVNGTGIDIRLADDSGYTSLSGRLQGTQDGTNDGLHVGSLNGDPSGTTNGGIWYNTSTNQLKARINSSSIVLFGAINSDVVANRIPIISTTSGRLLTDSNITYGGSGILNATQFNAGAGSFFSWNGRSLMSSPANGTIRFTSSTSTSMTMLQFGPSNNTTPGLKVNGSALEVRLTDDSNYASLTSGPLTVAGNITMGSASLTGGDRSITAVSSTTNCNVVISPQGAGNTILRYDGGAAHFRLGLPTDSGATRNITVDGSTSDISFGVVTKGNGNINLSSGAGTGYVQLISQGRVYKFGEAATFSGSLELPTLTTSSDITLTSAHFMVGVDTTGGNKIVTLPPVDSCPGRIYAIQKIDSSGNMLQVAAAVGDNIEGNTTRTISVQWACSIYFSDGSVTWRRLSNV